MSLLEGFDFIAAEKDTSKKIESLASALERVATIFLNGIGALETQLNDLQTRLAKVETQVETLLRVGVGRGASASIPDRPSRPSRKEEPEAPARAAPPTPTPPPVTAHTGPSASTPPSPRAPMGGTSVKAQMLSELRGFLARRRQVLQRRGAD